MGMGYKHYNLHYNWIARSFGENFGTCTASGEYEIVLGLLQQTSPDPVNPVAINYSNACMSSREFGMGQRYV